MSHRSQASILRKIKKAWLAIGRNLADFQARILLFLLFFAVILPIGLIWKILRKDPLGKKPDKTVNSYFVTSTQLEDSHWERMF